ncbi:MAG: RidA family protein [Smithellaceae bacterium]|jgi:2-iminobutanoate/2-iminopropanoate deaminase|nr:RidA family protein [Smithellaceae bacterium]MDD5415296.1 RidA family protein [Smithellaceae bacterium]HBJ75177.1 reactive intermediate/imine deaminase [Syntrophaceae bacterium]
MDKKIITSKNMPASGPYSMAVEANGMIFISGQLPVNPSTGEIVTAIEPATRQVLTNLKTILEENGLSLNHVVKTTIFLKRMTDFAVVNEIYGGFFADAPPARSTIEVSALPRDVPLEIEAVAIRK